MYTYRLSQLRTAPQSSDQSFEHRDNKALLVCVSLRHALAECNLVCLQRSVETQNPVRVIRGFKLKSKYAPREGYRYDGLYTVEKVRRSKVFLSTIYLFSYFYALFRRGVKRD